MDSVSRGEVAEAQIDAFISRRDDKRRRVEGERDEEALWMASVRRYEDRRRRRNRAAWFAYYCQQADAHRKLSESYEARAEALCSEAKEGDAA